MATLAFDSLRYARKLMEAGVPEQQAGVLVELMAEAFGFYADNLVTNPSLDSRLGEQEARIDTRFAQQDALIEKRFAEQNARIEKRFLEQDARIDARFAEQGARVDARFAELDARVDTRFAELDRKFDALNKQFREELSQIRVTLGKHDVMLVTIFAATVINLVCDFLL